MINRNKRSISARGALDGVIHLVTFYWPKDEESVQTNIEDSINKIRTTGVSQYTACANKLDDLEIIDEDIALRDPEASRDLSRVNCISCLSAWPGTSEE